MAGHMIKSTFGAALRRIRTKKKKKRSALSRETGLGYGFLQRIEKGEKQPSITTLFLLAAALDVTPGDLLAEAWNEWNAAGQPDPKDTSDTD